LILILLLWKGLGALRAIKKITEGG